MGPLPTLACLCLAALLTGCASSGRIGGTVSAPGTAKSAPPDGEATSGRASKRGSIADAVVYVEKLSPEVDSRLSTPRGKARIDHVGQEFSPRILVVAAGTSVEFRNRDSVFHNVFSVSPSKRFDLGRYGPGESRRATFATPGPVNVYCDLHPKASAVILVAPNKAFARADSLGRFVLPPLPPGRYVVDVWHPEFPVTRRKITVTEGGRAEIGVSLGS